MNDNDLSEHSLLVRVRGGFQALFSISTEAEKSRLHLNLQTPDCQFVVFDTATHRVALNRTALSFWQFLWDPAYHRVERTSHAMVGADEDTASERDEPFRFWLIEGGAPITFGVDFDAPGEEEIDPEKQPLANVFLGFELFDDDDLLNFIDEDGEQVFIRTAHVAVCSIPLAYIRGDFDDED